MQKENRRIYLEKINLNITGFRTSYNNGYKVSLRFTQMLLLVATSGSRRRCTQAGPKLIFKNPASLPDNNRYCLLGKILRLQEGIYYEYGNLLFFWNRKFPGCGKGHRGKNQWEIDIHSGGHE